MLSEAINIVNMKEKRRMEKERTGKLSSLYSIYNILDKYKLTRGKSRKERP